MAYATYRAGPGGHPEPSLSLPDFGGASEGFSVPSHATNLATRIEVVALPSGVTRRVSVWAALVLAAARQRHGPWVTVRLEPGEWALVQRRAPWLRKASDAFQWLTPDGFTVALPDIIARWRGASARPYVVENERTLARFERNRKEHP